MRRYEIWNISKDYIAFCCFNKSLLNEYVDSMKKARLTDKYMCYVFDHVNNKLLEQAIVRL